MLIYDDDYAWDCWMNLADMGLRSTVEYVQEKNSFIGLKLFMYSFQRLLQPSLKSSVEGVWGQLEEATLMQRWLTAVQYDSLMVWDTLHQEDEV